MILSWDKKEQGAEEGPAQATYGFACVSSILGLDPTHRSCEAGIIIAPTHPDARSPSLSFTLSSSTSSDPCMYTALRLKRVHRTLG